MNGTLVFVHAFNDKDVIAGQGTAALEMLEDAPEIDTLPVPIGGGGLIAGMATVAKNLRPDLKVYGVEAAMYPSFTAKMRNLTPAIGGQTIAEGIAVKKVGEITYAIARPLIEDVLLIDEPISSGRSPFTATLRRRWRKAQARRLWRRFWPDRTSLRAETAGLILCGGNIDTRLLASCPHPRACSRKADHLHSHHRRRPARTFGRCLQHHRRSRGKHHRGGP